MVSRENLVIVRYGPEVTLKSRRTRQQFLDALRRNAEDALARFEVPHRLTVDRARMLVETEAADDAAGVLARVFGIGSVSPVEAVTDPEVPAIARVGGEVFAERVRYRTFAVRAKKVGRYPFSSMDIEKELGAALVPYGKVDLDDPEVTLWAELFGGKAYLLTRWRAGPGGLPTGVQGRALALISGGFDSAVAAWRVMKRGIAVDYLFCNLGGAAYERMVLQVVKLLTEAWAFGIRPQLHVVDFEPLVGELRARVRPQYWQVVLKRLMYRAAFEIASQADAKAIVTGEAIGQVSSQTISNLCAIEPGGEVPVLRPLVAMDKQEIIDEARRIGTAPLSERVREYCAITPARPVVACTRERVDREERRLDAAALARAIAARKTIDLCTVRPSHLRTPYLFTEEIPEGAVVIDCQPRHMYEVWHVPNAEHRSFDDLRENFRRLNKSRTYVLYCTHGVVTPYLAELMQQFGYEAYAFKGGVAELSRYLAQKAA